MRIGEPGAYLIALSMMFASASWTSPRSAIAVAFSPVDLEPHRRSEPAAHFDDLGDQPAHVERLEQARVLALELREQNQVVDQRAHPPAFGGDRGKDELRAFVRRTRAPAQQVDVAQHDRQGRAQFVARVGDELPHLRFGRIAFGERRRHLFGSSVVGVREHVEIALARDRDRLRPKIAGGEPLQRLGHVDQRTDRLLRDEAADKERQRARPRSTRTAPSRRSRRRCSGRARGRVRTRSRR